MGEVMKLIDVVRELDSFDGDATIYAVEPWTADSPAFVGTEPEDGGLPATASGQGMAYFLEVFIACDFLADWGAAQSQHPTLAEKCERLIRYAVDDA